MSSFNVDALHPVIVGGPAAELFGYSLAVQGGEDQPSLYVGDPLNDHRGDVSGAVYQCRWELAVIPSNVDLTTFNLHRIFLDSSSGSCRRLELSDEMTGGEVRTRQLLGLHLALTDSAVLHSCAPRRQVRVSKTWSTASGNVVAEYLAMQGKCWQYDLTNSQQSHGNYLNTTRKFYVDPSCPRGSSCRYGSLYSSLGMSVHSSEDGTVLFGAPGTYTWEGTLAALQ